MMGFPKRKRTRIEGYDYSQNGAYFVTICTHNRECLFGDVEADSISARLIDGTFVDTIQQYPCVNCPTHVIMPNHFHAILRIDRADAESRADMESAPTVSNVIQSFKRRSTIEYIKRVKAGSLPPFDGRTWQRSFHDHIIRNEREYEMIWKYIAENPYNWKDDCFFVKDESASGGR